MLACFPLVRRIAQEQKATGFRADDLGNDSVALVRLVYSTIFARGANAQTISLSATSAEMKSAAM